MQVYFCVITTYMRIPYSTEFSIIIKMASCFRCCSKSKTSEDETDTELRDPHEIAPKRVVRQVKWRNPPYIYVYPPSYYNQYRNNHYYRSRFRHYFFHRHRPRSHHSFRHRHWLRRHPSLTSIHRHHPPSTYSMSHDKSKQKGKSSNLEARRESTHSPKPETSRAHSEKPETSKARGGKGKKHGKGGGSRTSVSSVKGTSSSDAAGPSTSKKTRRKSIPFKPNYSINLWAIMKNSIGKDLSKIPMPVNFNEPLSMLQRLTEEFEYSDILNKAARCSDNHEQMAYVAAFTVSPYASTANRTGKPFNPLLGETFECDRRSDLGWASISEQVSHHPPIVALHCVGKDWICWQDFSMASKFRGGTIQIIPLGSSHLTFNSSGNHYVWRKITTTVHNIIFGKLRIEQSGEMDIINYKTKDRCHLIYLTPSYFSSDPPNKVIGEILDAKGGLRWTLSGQWDSYLAGVKVPEDQSRLLWKPKPLPPNSERMYGFTELAIELNEPEHGVAPTDSRRRPDQRLMENGYWKEANKKKLYLEEKQRVARKHLEQQMAKAVASGKSFPPYEPVWFKKRKDPTTGDVMHIYNGKYWECKAKQDWKACPDIF